MLKQFVVDAFADAPFEGNPAAVMPLSEWLPDTTLQAIAAEIGEIFRRSQRDPSTVG